MTHLLKRGPKNHAFFLRAVSVWNRFLAIKMTIKDNFKVSASANRGVCRIQVFFTVKRKIGRTLHCSCPHKRGCPLNMRSACNVYLPDDVRGSGLEKWLIWGHNTDSFEKRFSLGRLSCAAGSRNLCQKDYTTRSLNSSLTKNLSSWPTCKLHI